ncbi:hypothetical protein [Mycobacteroides abscessus]|uniref:hypothetical protein n=1 Tax=Mycobacteroides abscessus TaxID=36809 RepID=UPI0010573FF8|nr:hypothetical protein [Mycobacteroides abscessus]
MNQTDDGTEPLGEAPEVFRPGRDPLYAAAQLLESRGYAVVELPKPIQNGLGGFAVGGGFPVGVGGFVTAAGDDVVISEFPGSPITFRSTDRALQLAAAILAVIAYIESNAVGASHG